MKHRMGSMSKNDMSQRYPSYNRGINGNGTNQKGGGSTGKHTGGMGMSPRLGAGKSGASKSGY